MKVTEGCGGGYTKVELDDDESKAFWDSVAGPQTVRHLMDKVMQNPNRKVVFTRSYWLKNEIRRNSYHLVKATQLQAEALLLKARGEINHKEYMSRFEVILDHVKKVLDSSRKIKQALCTWATDELEGDERIEALHEAMEAFTVH